MKFIDWFAGIGGFRRGMELAGHECVGFCEFDKFATASYISMHLLTNEQRRALQELPLKKRQKEILKDEYRNGEWYANDVRRVWAGRINIKVRSLNKKTKTLSNRQYTNSLEDCASRSQCGCFIDGMSQTRDVIWIISAHSGAK